MTENTHNPQVGEKATRLQRLTKHWVYGGVPLSCLLLVLILSFQNHLSWLQFLLALHLPVYMWHQYEEHDNNRFKAFADTQFGPGVLSDAAIFVINVVGVWALFSVLILLSIKVSTGLGLGVAFLTAINAVTHVGALVKTRSYNPGLITAVGLFLPLSLITLRGITTNPEVSRPSILLGFIVGAGVHAAIMIYARSRRGR